MVTNSSANTPTGTTGTVLQGQGAGASLELSTATYPATTTVSEILYSSSTNTVAGLATANKAVLTTGAAGVPVWAPLTDGQVIIGSSAGAPIAASLTAGAGITITNASNSITIAANGSVPNPLTTSILYDDFLGVTQGNSPIIEGLTAWTRQGFQYAGTNVIGTSTTAHPGIWTLGIPYFNSTNGIYSAYLPGGVKLGEGTYTLQYCFKLDILGSSSRNYTLRIGYGDTASGAHSNGVYFEYNYNVNSGNWQIITASGGTRTTSNTGNAVDTSFHTLKIIVNAAASSVSYYIDGVLMTTNNTITTNIPTANIYPWVSMLTTSGANKADQYLQIDLFAQQIDLTVSR